MLLTNATLAFCRLVIGLVFVLSAVGKLRDLRAFASAIRAFELLPGGLSLPAAWIFALLEGLTVLLLLGGPALVLLGLALATALLLCFCVALAIALRRGQRTACRCFGSSVRPISPYDLWRNAGLILCALAGGWCLAGSGGAASQLGAGGWALSALAAGIFVAVWLHLAEIGALFSAS